jgi:hypothetical protein
VTALERELLAPDAAARTLQRDLMNRATFKRLLRSVASSADDPLQQWLKIDTIERQLAGVFTAAEIRYMAQVIDSYERRRVWGGIRACIEPDRFGQLPGTPRLTRQTVALAAAALEGRLLALFTPAPGSVAAAPDDTLATATHYTRANVRQSLARTLRAIGLGRLPGSRYPPRTAPSGSTRLEMDAYRERRAQSARRLSERRRAAK